MILLGMFKSNFDIKKSKKKKRRKNSLVLLKEDTSVLVSQMIDSIIGNTKIYYTIRAE